MSNAIIIGAGLFGCVIAAELRSRGMDVTLVDARKEGSGSKPAACLMKPSWYASMGPEMYRPALDLLDRLYGVQDVEFQTVTKMLPVKVKWIPPTKILNKDSLEGRLVNAMKTRKGWRCKIETPGGFTVELEANHLIVAAGIWTNEVLRGVENSWQIPGLQSRQGIAWLMPNQQVPTPFIKVWAPYRQLVAFNRSKNEGWVSDGTSVKELSMKNIENSMDRCSRAVGFEKELHSVIGNRPYIQGVKPCCITDCYDFTPNLHVVTGGAKNGTIAAGWAAHVLGQRIC